MLCSGDGHFLTVDYLVDGLCVNGVNTNNVKRNFIAYQVEEINRKGAINTNHTAFFLLAIMSLLTFATTAQEYIYKNYGSKDGLRNAPIYQMLQDKDGFL